VGGFKRQPHTAPNKGKWQDRPKDRRTAPIGAELSNSGQTAISFLSFVLKA